MPDLSEQGDPIAGYEEKGPYHCEDCVHRKADTEYCQHPAVIAAPIMKKRLVNVGNQMLARINVEHGCCKFVKQTKRDND